MQFSGVGVHTSQDQVDPEVSYQDSYDGSDRVYMKETWTAESGHRATVKHGGIDEQGYERPCLLGVDFGCQITVLRLNQVDWFIKESELQLINDSCMPEKKLSDLCCYFTEKV